MHTFVIVASRPGSALDPMVTDLLTSVAPACVGFAPQQHVHWAALDGSVHFGGWCAEELVPSTARTVDGRLVAIGGLPILTSPNEEASLLGADSAARDARALRGLTERLDGAYAIASLAPDGAGTVVNDPFGLHPLYLGGVGPVTAVSNDAALVATVLAHATGRPPAPDEEAVAWLLLNGQMFGDATPYRDVCRLPFGSSAVLEAGTVSIRSWHERPWSPGDTMPPFEQLLDEAEARMIRTIRAGVTASPDETWSELTAGRDSRMMLDLASRAGLAGRLRFCTYGPVSSPDGRVASEIARTMGLRHESASWPAMRGGPTLDNLIEQVRSVSAQISCWESSNPGRHTGITFSGLTGESLRTNYPRKAGLTTIDAAIAGFDSHRFGRYHYVRPRVLRDLQDRARELFVAPHEAGVAPEDLFDVFYMQHRLRRWIGDKPRRFSGTLFPLYSPFTVGIAMRRGWERRAQAEIHEEIARRARLPIDHLDFEQGTRWRADQTSMTGGSTAPATVGHPSAPDHSITTRRLAIRDAVEFDPANRAFDMVDRDAMLADAARYQELDRRQQIELHHALTVVLWLGVCRPDQMSVRG